MWTTSHPRSWIKLTTDAMMWHWYESRRIMGMIPWGVSEMYSEGISSTQCSITLVHPRIVLCFVDACMMYARGWRACMSWCSPFFCTQHGDQLVACCQDGKHNGSTLCGICWGPDNNGFRAKNFKHFFEASTNILASGPYWWSIVDPPSVLGASDG